MERVLILGAARTPSGRFVRALASLSVPKLAGATVGRKRTGHDTFV